MLSALFSIRPEYVEKILSEEKKYEFRKILCKSHIDKIVIYETSPVCRIVGETEVSKILESSPNDIWNKTCNFAGIKYESFKHYFRNSNKAFAYCLQNPVKYNKPVLLKDIGVRTAPQSFIYLTDEQYKTLEELNNIK